MKSTLKAATIAAASLLPAIAAQASCDDLAAFAKTRNVALAPAAVGTSIYGTRCGGWTKGEGASGGSPYLVSFSQSGASYYVSFDRESGANRVLPVSPDFSANSASFHDGQKFYQFTAGADGVHGVVDGSGRRSFHEVSVAKPFP